MMEKGGNIEQNIFTLVSALVGFRRMVEQQIPSASGLDFVKHVIVPSKEGDTRVARL